MTRATLHLMLFALIATIAACTEQGADVPRRKAFPRVATLDTTMRQAANVPIRMDINAAAIDSVPHPNWLDVKYPKYGATMHITFSPTTPAEVAKIKANRMERLLLNVGDCPTVNREFTNRAGYSIVVARSQGSATPLQFIATDDSSMVVSGAVYMADPRAASEIDSITPTIDAIAADIDRAMATLGL
jgi:hypothetical protein